MSAGKEHIVAKKEDINEGERIVVDVEGREVGIFLINGKYRAFLNWCAHQAGPCAEGSLTGTNEATFDRETLDLSISYVREGEILNCPWHGWEYDIETGECLSRQNVKLPTYPVKEENGKIIVTI